MAEMGLFGIVLYGAGIVAALLCVTDLRKRVEKLEALNDPISNNRDSQ